jgi:hypothetical protein
MAGAGLNKQPGTLDDLIARLSRDLAFRVAYAREKWLWQRKNGKLRKRLERWTLLVLERLRIVKPPEWDGWL